MRGILFVFAFIILFGCLYAISFHGGRGQVSMPQNPQKIVSLAPAITETLFALGLGDRVVGVTKFCAWPPEAAQKEKVGGFLEVNPEAIARTGADLAVLPVDMAHFKKILESLGIPAMLFDYSSLESFLGAARSIGRITGKEAQAEKLAAGFEEITGSEKPEKRPRVLFALLTPGEYDRPVNEMTIIGADKFYNELIRAAGGKNVYTGSTPFPRLSLEAVIAMDPDVIVIGAPEIGDISPIEKRWRDIGHLKGVKDGRLLILNDPGDTIPGPRSLETLKKLEKAIDAARESD